MIFAMKVKNTNNQNSWWELIETDNSRCLSDEEYETAKEAARIIIRYLNRTLGPKESPRKLLKVRLLEK